MPRVDVETVQGVDPLVGSIFDKRFRIEERIASGGFGAIYRAQHVKSGHVVALKVLLPELAQDLGVVARFRREGTTLTALRSPHTIAAYELGQAADRTLFIVMELLHGESVFERYRNNGPFEWKRMVKIAREVCTSLAEAHRLGIVHRDLKPTNIHLERHGDDVDFVKVLDFGIAKILRGSDFDQTDITNAGQMIGTLDYMSPEQMVGGHVTGQTDIYTLGIVMYEMIAGTTPFPEAETAAAALGAMLKTKPQPLYLRAPVPEILDRVVMRCLEREVHKRYKTVTELGADLAKVVGGRLAENVRTVEVDTRALGGEATMVTPPPDAVRASLARRGTSANEWQDQDEYAATATGRPDNARLREAAQSARPSERSAGAREHRPSEPPKSSARTGEPKPAMRPSEPVKSSARASEAERATQPSAPAKQLRSREPSRPGDAATPPRRAASEPSRPPSRPLPRQDTPPPNLVVAPFSNKRGAPTPAQQTLPTPLPHSGSHAHAMMRAPTHPPVPSPHSPSAPHIEMPRAASPHTTYSTPPLPGYPQQPHAAASSTPANQPYGAYPAPANQPSSEYSSPTYASPAGPNLPVSSGASYPPSRTPTPHGLDIAGRPPTDGHHIASRRSTSAYDMGEMAAREATIRRFVWIIVLVVAAAIGIALATLL